ncbi:MAG: hypothetical protein IPF73_00315 [Betaproteobacteria bacterium]|nr:hypothetical protein [Betaproteobacteria bacterium]
MKALVYTAPCEVVHRDEPEPCPGAIGAAGRRAGRRRAAVPRHAGDGRPEIAASADRPGAVVGGGTAGCVLANRLTGGGGAVGAASTRSAMAAVKPGGVVLTSGSRTGPPRSMRKLTPAESRSGTYTSRPGPTARRWADGARAFDDDGARGNYDYVSWRRHGWLRDA